jgi:chromosome segregation ATPase
VKDQANKQDAFRLVCERRDAAEGYLKQIVQYHTSYPPYGTAAKNTEAISREFVWLYAQNQAAENRVQKLKAEKASGDPSAKKVSDLEKEVKELKEKLKEKNEECNFFERDRDLYRDAWERQLDKLERFEDALGIIEETVEDARSTDT